MRKLKKMNNEERDRYLLKTATCLAIGVIGGLVIRSHISRHYISLNTVNKILRENLSGPEAREIALERISAGDILQILPADRK